MVLGQFVYMCLFFIIGPQYTDFSYNMYEHCYQCIADRAQLLHHAPNDLADKLEFLRDIELHKRYSQGITSQTVTFSNVRLRLMDTNDPLQREMAWDLYGLLRSQGYYTASRQFSTTIITPWLINSIRSFVV